MLEWDVYAIEDGEPVVRFEEERDVGECIGLRGSARGEAGLVPVAADGGGGGVMSVMRLAMGVRNRRRTGHVGAGGRRGV